MNLDETQLPEEKTGRDKRKWLNFVGEQGFIIVFVLWALLLSFSTRSFATTENIFTVLRQATIIGILAIGEHFIVLLGTMDISVAASLSLTGVAMGALLQHFGLPPVLAALLTGVGTEVTPR